MAITVKHSKVSLIPDGDDSSVVRPSDWNDDHVLTGTIPVDNGGTGAATLTGYVKGNGTAAMTASATIPNTDITGLGTASTKDAGAANGVATLDAGGKVPVSELPAAVLGALSYQGTWDASTNTPTLTSSVGTKGYYYVVSVAGNTNLNGITDWLVGDWAVYNGTVWQKVDNTETVTSVNGQTGAVVLTTTNVAEGTNLYYTDARARTAISAGTGISYDNSTGVVTNAAPDQTVALTDGTAIDVTGTYPNFTINNTAPDQTVVLTAGTGISTSGTYPNFTIANTAPSLGGDVVGPTGATDNAIARYDTTTGKLIQNSLVIIDDTGSVTGVNALTAESLTVNNNATLGSSNTDTLDVNARITTDLEPNANNAKDIGTSGRNWRDGFFGRTVHTVNLELTGTTSFDGSQGTSGQVLTSAGTGNTPTWTTPTTGTVTSVAALTLGTTGTDLSSTVANGTTTPVITLQVPTASAVNRGALSSTDWSTFNGKQDALVSGTNIKTVSGTSLLGSGDLGTIGVAYGGTGTSTAFTAGSIVFAGASGTYSQDNANLFWDNTNKNLGIGSAPFTGYKVYAAGNALFGNNTNITPDANWSGQLTINGNAYSGGIALDATGMWVGHNSAGRALLFATDETERMRLTANGALYVGTTSGTFGSAGTVIFSNGQTNMVANGDTILFINRLTNDGTLVSFSQAGTQEGTISVSGTTVSYNGGHLSRYAQTITAKDESLLKGTVLSNLDEMNTYIDVERNAAENEQLNKVKVSDVEGDANVAGVFVNWYFDEQHQVDEINMAMTGDMIIRIGQGVTVNRGDLLMSAGDGTAKPQGDDLVRSKTIAKVTSTHITCTYADGSYCVPCVLMAC